jgi:hypothetical protein
MTMKWCLLRMAMKWWAPQNKKAGNCHSERSEESLAESWQRVRFVSDSSSADGLRMTIKWCLLRMTMKWWAPQNKKAGNCHSEEGTVK